MTDNTDTTNNVETASRPENTSAGTEQVVQTPQKLLLRYRFIRELGEGANGKTYLAQNIQTGARVAIKALKLNLSEGFKSFELFKREAETLSSIQVNGVPKFYESVLSEVPGEECYIIQEYIEAPSIQYYLDQGRKFSESETLIIMAKITQILHCLQTQYAPPVIHRDIKPSNILCKLPEGTKWNLDNIQTHLIDFGAVANANSNSDKSTIAGTVGYMAPEQNFGECKPQTDFYALGATALHMLTGIPPYEMDFETYSICFEKYLNEHAPKTSEDMRELLKSLLNYAANKRPESAAALMQTIIDIYSKHHTKKNAIKRISKINRAVRRFYYNLCDKLVKAPDPMECIDALSIEDPKCKVIQGTVQLSFKDTLEYTFTVNEKTWAGISFKSNCDAVFSDKSLKTYSKLPELHKFMNASKLSDSDTFKVPLECVVLYNVYDPSCNKLYYIRLSSNLQKGDSHQGERKTVQLWGGVYQEDLLRAFRHVIEDRY